MAFLQDFVFYFHSHLFDKLTFSKSDIYIFLDVQ